MSDLEYARALRAQDQPVPLDVMARLIEQGYGVQDLT